MRSEDKQHRAGMPSFPYSGLGMTVTKLRFRWLTLAENSVHVLFVRRNRSFEECVPKQELGNAGKYAEMSYRPQVT